MAADTVAGAAMSATTGAATIACVLYQGRDVPAHSRGIFTPEWVDRLYRGVARHCTQPFRFVCYVDREDYAFREPVEARPLALPYRNMFCLLEVFREDLGRAVFMGLDTIIVGNIDRLMGYRGPFAMLPDPYFPRPCSGVMAFPYTPHVWDAFRADHARHAREVTMFGWPSDMIYLARHDPALLDDAGIYSYKARCRAGLPADASIIYFHGREKPHELLHLPWVREHWGGPEGLADGGPRGRKTGILGAKRRAAGSFALRRQ